MATDNHDPIEEGAPADSDVVNAPLGQLDAAMGNVDNLTTDATNLTDAVNEVQALISSTVDTEAFLRATGDNELEALIDDLIIEAGTSDAETIAARGGESVLDNRLDKIEYRVYNVRRSPFNAAGDGVTDDSAALQAAWDSADSAGGGLIVIPPGDYVLETAIEIADANHITIQGYGTASHIIMRAVGAVSAAFSFSNCDNIVIRDLLLTQNDPDLEYEGTSTQVQITSAIEFKDTSRNCIVDNVHIEGIATTDGSDSFTINDAVTLQDSFFCTVKNCFFQFNRVGFRCKADDATNSNPRYNSCLNNTAQDLHRFFMISEILSFSPPTPLDEFWDGHGAFHNLIAFNRATDVRHIFGKIDFGAMYITVLGNHIIRGGTVADTDDSDPGMIDVQSPFCKIIDNTFDCQNYVHESLIYVSEHGLRSIVQGNVMAPVIFPGTGASHSGILLGIGAQYVQVLDNIIRGDGSGATGILLAGGNDHCRISGNQISHVVHGIDLNAANAVTVTNNIIVTCSGRGIWVVGGDRHTIGDNHIDTTGNAGILIGSTAKHITIHHNMVRNANTSAGSDLEDRANIGIESAAAGISIVGNTCLVQGGSPTASIEASGAAQVCVGFNITEHGVHGTGTDYEAGFNKIQA